MPLPQRDPPPQHRAVPGHGVCQETSLPVLFMELMDREPDALLGVLQHSFSLPRTGGHQRRHHTHTDLPPLQRHHPPRPLQQQCVADIGPGYRAKVTDFGMSKFTEMHPHMTLLTKCPGSQAYMAPEALQEEPLYTTKLDVFQAGVLMVQIIRKVRDLRSPMGIIWMTVPEIERRHNHMSLIADTHSMVRGSHSRLLEGRGKRSSHNPAALPAAVYSERSCTIFWMSAGGERGKTDGG